MKASTWPATAGGGSTPKAPRGNPSPKTFPPGTPQEEAYALQETVRKTETVQAKPRKVNPKTLNLKKTTKTTLKPQGKPLQVPHDPKARYGVLSDVDGTITKGSLVLDHAIYLHNKGLINLGGLPLQWLQEPKNEKLVVALAEAYKDAIAGHKVEDLQVEEFLEAYSQEPARFYKTLTQLKEFKRRGWEVQLISGSPDYLVKAFAARHGFFGVGSAYKTWQDGRLTGEVEGMFGQEAKEGYIQKLNLPRFKRVLAFGDTASDMPLFAHADHSTLVDPTEETLAKVQATLVVRE